MTKFASHVAQLKQNVIEHRYEQAEAVFTEIKKLMLELDSLPPILMESPTAAEEIQLAREALEYGVLLSVRMHDKVGFYKSMSALKPYLILDNTTASSLSETIVGLHLLYLLVENRLADFHGQLELLSGDILQSAAVRFCTQLETHLVVGAYDQVLKAAENPPLSDFSFFLKSLLETVRTNIGECMANAYVSIKLPSATKMLMYSNNEETLEFINYYYPQWQVADNTILIQQENRTNKSEEIPSLRLITNTLTYATELERIV